MPVLPTRRAAIVALVIAIGLIAYPGEEFNAAWAAVGITGFIAAIALLDGLVATSAAQIVVQRRHQPVVVVGQTAEIKWVIQSSARRTLRVMGADALAPSLGARTRRFKLTVPPEGSSSFKSTLKPARRGRFTLDRLSVRIEGRLGLGSRQRDIPLQSVLRVHPAFASAEDAELKVRRMRELEVGLRSARGLGGGTDFEQLREYGPDDEVRRVDWVATARVGKPIVRTYRAERNQNVLILLDNGRIMAGRVDGVPRVEHAMDAAMTVTAVATRLGDKCGLVAFDQVVRVVVPPSRNPSQLGTVTEAMHALSPQLDESDYQGAFTEVLSRFKRRSLLILLTDILDSAVTDSLLPALPLISRKHLVMVAAARDPAVESWRTEPVTDSEEAYLRVAAVDSLGRRRRAATMLRSRGALVVDAPTNRLSVDITDAYLKAKATGRL